MLIDWFTVGAQLLNFLVLVWLLKRFLYRPVLAAIDARERQVAAVLAEAEAKKAEARDEREALGAKNAAFEHDRAALWATANADAQTERKRLLDAAAQAADALAARRRDSLRQEAAAFHQTIGLQAQQQVFAIARQTLADLADTSLEDRIGAVFIDRLRALDGPARERWAAAARAEPGPLRVRSAFVLPEPLRAKLHDAVREVFSADAPLQFDLAPALAAGIELTAGDERLDWSIAGQVDALARQVAEWVAPPLQAGPAAQSEADPAPPPGAGPAPVAAPEAIAA